MMPEIVGPIAGATAMTMEITPIMRPRRWAGTRLSTVFISSGSIRAVPLAWTMRPVRSSSNPGAVAANNVPTVKSDIDATNT